MGFSLIFATMTNIYHQLKILGDKTFIEAITFLTYLFVSQMSYTFKTINLSYHLYTVVVFLRKLFK